MSELLEDGVAADPLEQFRRWHAEAGNADAMALATATPDGAPSVRMVLLKGADEHGFVFFTGYGSRKGGELEANPRAALLFHWDGRQVRVEGRVERVGGAESDSYFATRPRGAQLAAAASQQGRTLANRAQLDESVGINSVEGFLGSGVYNVPTDAFEFWQHRDDRLHDRLRFVREADGWRLERLAP